MTSFDYAIQIFGSGLENKQQQQTRLNKFPKSNLMRFLDQLPAKIKLNSADDIEKEIIFAQAFLYFPPELTKQK